MSTAEAGTQLAGDWRIHSDGESLLGSECPACGKRAFPKRDYCDACGNEKGMATVPLSRTGILYSYTVVRVAPPAFKVPYTVGFIDLPEDVRVFAQIDADDDLA